MTDNIADTLARYIVTTILKQPSRAIKEDESLITSGLIDSFHLVDLALFVEDRFGVRIEDSELNASTFDSLLQLAEIIRQRKT